MRRDFLNDSKSHPDDEAWGLAWVAKINHLYHINNQRIQEKPGSAAFQQQTRLLQVALQEIQDKIQAQQYYENEATEVEKNRIKFFLIRNNLLAILCICVKNSIEEVIQAKLQFNASEEIFVNPDFVLNFTKQEFQQLFEFLEDSCKKFQINRKNFDLSYFPFRNPILFSSFVTSFDLSTLKFTKYSILCSFIKTCVFQ